MKCAKFDETGKPLCPKCGSGKYRRLDTAETISPNYVNVYVICEDCQTVYFFSESLQKSPKNETVASRE